MSAKSSSEGKSHLPRIVGLRPAQLTQLRKLTHYEGLDGLPFFENAVWWWRPLLRILGPNRRGITVPSKAERAFFSVGFFETLIQAERIGDLGDQLSFLVSCELTARLDIPLHSNGLIWPGFLSQNILTVYGDDFMSAHTVSMPARTIDLRKSTIELASEFKREVTKLRKARSEEMPFPVPRFAQKTSFLSKSTFLRIELIDQKMSLGNKVDGGEWANVTKLVRQSYSPRG